MLGLFAEAQTAGPITSAEMQSLQTLVSPGVAAALNMASSVQSLAYKVVDGDPANAQYQGATSVISRLATPRAICRNSSISGFWEKTLPRSTCSTCRLT